MLVVELQSFDIRGKDIFEIEEFSTDSTLTGPVWQDNQVLRPLCSLKGSSAIFLSSTVRFSFQGPTARGQVSCELKAESNVPALTFIGEVNVSADGEKQVDLDLDSGQLADDVKVELLTLDWSFRLDGATSWTDLVTTGPLRVFQVLAEPLTWAYDFGLEKACTYALSAANPAQAISEGIATDIFYDPKHIWNGHVLSLYTKMTGADCNSHAQLMEHLCCSIGLEAEQLYLWGGTKNDRVSYRHETSLGINWPSLQLQAPEIDASKADPHFQFHVLVEAGGLICDPCFGTQGFSAIETAPGFKHVSDREGWTNTTKSSWTCPH